MERALGESELAALAEQLAACASQFDVFRYLREITQRFGYRYFAVNSIPREGHARMSETIIITSAPSDLIKRHDEFDFTASNPIALRMRSTGAPVEFRFDTPTTVFDGTEHSTMLSVLREYDLNTWLAVPVFTPGRSEAVISFLGNRDPAVYSELAELVLIGAYTQDRLSQVSARTRAPASPLTERELECLVWTSAGKTSLEIAKILDLSEHTVNHYLNNATRKSGTVNRTQTVAYALRNGWIE